MGNRLYNKILLIAEQKAQVTHRPARIVAHWFPPDIINYWVPGIQFDKRPIIRSHNSLKPARSIGKNIREKDEHYHNKYGEKLRHDSSILDSHQELLVEQYHE